MLRDLVARLNRATERRESTRRGTAAFRTADAVQRRYREILLDDDLFERFLSGDPLLDLDRPPRNAGPALQGAQHRATRRSGPLRARRVAAP